MTDEDAYINEIVENWPPFTDAQRTALKELLKPVQITAEFG